MKINKLFAGLKRLSNGDYLLEGDLISDEAIEIELDDRLVVSGSIISHRHIKAGCGIEAGDGIKAGWGIEAGWGIKAGWGIEADDGIKAGCDIEAGRGIKAGCGIEAGDGIKAGRGIKAGWGIEAGDGIKAGLNISSGKRIFAGLSLYKNSNTCDKSIRCAELEHGEICYGDLIITKQEE